MIGSLFIPDSLTFRWMLYAPSQLEKHFKMYDGQTIIGAIVVHHDHELNVMTLLLTSGIVVYAPGLRGNNFTLVDP